MKQAHYIWFLILGGLLTVYLLTDFGNTAVLSDTKKNIYSLLTPIALGLIILELVFCWLARKDYYTFQESVANFGTALGNQTTNILVAVFVYVTYGFLWNNFHIFDVDMHQWWHWLFLLVGIDFLFYWFHRWGHEINILWAAHSPHHSAEEMNLMVGLRASVTQRLFSFFFLWPLTILGFDPINIYIMTGVHLFIGYWHHTEALPKFWKWIEYVFNTPSHHRVHHGVNLQYLDKNYAEFLILWDRIFGTFEEEHEKVVYGMYNGPKSWNPIKINFHYYIQLWNDAVAAPYWWDKLRIWFMPLMWRPRGLAPKEAIKEITLENQVRYQTIMFPKAKDYLIVHMILTLVLMLFIINADSPWTSMERWIGAALLWHSVVNMSGILESKQWLIASELMRLFFLPLAFILFNDWHTNPLMTVVVITTALTSMAWTIRYFSPRKESSKKNFDLNI